MIDLTPFLQAVLGLATALVTGMLIPWIKLKTTAQQQAALAVAVDVLVFAAEQIYGSDKGQLKLEYVETELLKRGFKVDVAAIEAAVKRMKDAP